MGTKNNPGDYDCYETAEPDEPMFVLLARDSLAPALVEMWAAVREIMGTDILQSNEAMACAEAMRRWHEVNRG